MNEDRQEKFADRATQLRERIDADFEELYQLCRRGLVSIAVRPDDRLIGLLTDALLSKSKILAQYRAITDELLRRGA